MEAHQHHGGHGDGPAVSLNRLAARATTHCLTGCAIGEVLGLIIGTALGWAVLPTIGLAVGLAFAFGFGWWHFPVNRWLIARGRGHAVVHGSH